MPIVFCETITRHRLLRLGALAVLGVLLLALPDDGPGLLLAQGDAHFAAQEYAQALAFYQQAANRAPEDPAIYLRLGRLHLAKHRYLQAEAALRDALRLRTLAPLLLRPSAPLLTLGHVYAQTGRPALAAAAYRLAASEGEPAARYPLALTYLRLGHLERGQAELMGLFQAGDARAGLSLGLLLALSDPAAALPALQRAAQSADRAVAAAAGQALRELPAIRAEADPAYAAALVGGVALRLGLPEAALAAFGQAVQRDPAYAQAHAYLGYTLYLLGDPAAALSSLTQAALLDPADPLPHHFLGLVYRILGQPQRALAEMEMALAVDPGNPALLADLGETYATQKEYLPAQEYLAAAARADPQSEVPWLRLARFHLDTLFGVENGLAAAQQAVKLAPQSAEALDLLGWAFHLNRRPGEALATLRRAVELDATSSGAQYHLGAAAAQAGDMSMARRAYRRAIDLDTTGFYEERARKGLEGLGRE